MTSFSIQFGRLVKKLIKTKRIFKFFWYTLEVMSKSIDRIKRLGGNKSQ